MVQGPINRPKDGIAAFAGIIETDWAPYSFTMKWIFTQPGISVRFEKGEPYCHIFPVQLGALETIQPELRLLSENPELKREQRCLEREPLSIQHRPEGARLRRSSREVAEALLPWPRPRLGLQR
jgi:hypothetical protein